MLKVFLKPSQKNLFQIYNWWHTGKAKQADCICSKLRNTSCQGFDSYYIAQSGTGDANTSSEDILRSFWDKTDVDCDIGLNVSVGTLTMVSNKTADYLSDLPQDNHILQW